MHELDDLLARVEALEDVLAERVGLHAGDEVLDDLEVDVGLEQREADLAHRLVDGVLVQPLGAAEIAQGRLEPVGEGIEHGREVYGREPVLPHTTSTRSRARDTRAQSATRARANSRGSNGRRSSSPSPTPTSFTGRPSS